MTVCPHLLGEVGEDGVIGGAEGVGVGLPLGLPRDLDNKVTKHLSVCDCEVLVMLMMFMMIQTKYQISKSDFVQKLNSDIRQIKLNFKNIPYSGYFEVICCFMWKAE